jgi:MinD superfamily P-loop ATPase
MVTEPTPLSVADCNRLIDILNLNEVELRALVLNKFNLFPEAERFEAAVSGLRVPVVKIPWDTDLLKGLKPGKEYFRRLVEVVL